MNDAWCKRRLINFPPFSLLLVVFLVLWCMVVITKLRRINMTPEKIDKTDRENKNDFEPQRGKSYLCICFSCACIPGLLEFKWELICANFFYLIILDKPLCLHRICQFLNIWLIDIGDIIFVDFLACNTENSTENLTRNKTISVEWTNITESAFCFSIQLQLWLSCCVLSTTYIKNNTNLN